MALNFPANPVDGQVYGTYTYNATKGVWSSSSIPQAYTVSETVPSNPRNGDVWFNSANAKSYVYYSDDDSSQWVEIGGQEGSPGTPSSLGAIPDVSVAGVTDGNALIYDAASGNWIPGEGGGKFTVSDTAPSEAENGDTWFKSDDGKTYIYYVDADGGQWVEIASNTTGYLDIGQLNDVTIVSPTTGQALTYDGSGWVNATPASTLGSLTDVDTDGVADGQALVYDSANSEWVPGSAAPSGVNVLDSDTINVDFSDNVPAETRGVAGPVTFTGSNYVGGVNKKIYIEGDSTKHSLSFPTGWQFINDDKPVETGELRNNVLDLTTFGNTESSVVALWLGLSSFEPISATGGTESEIILGGITWKAHYFYNTGLLNVSSLGDIGTISYLVVGGGGSGGAGSGGAGGGAGGFLFADNYSLSTGTKSITVGAGGAPSTGQGQNSSFESITAIGGGYGGSQGGANGATGGSGGGAQGGGGSGSSTTTYGQGTAGQGNRGGTGWLQNVNDGGGGGGGAGEIGGAASGNRGGDGGDGIQWWLDQQFYAGGGGGSSYSGAGSSGGLGGGGIGGFGASSTPGGNALINTGGGGGSGSTGGSGGSGIVAIAYPLTDPN